MIDRATHINSEAERFGAALAEAPADAKVPTCPEWNSVDLLKHLTQVHDFWAAVIGDKLEGSQVEAYQEARTPLPDDRAQLLTLRADATKRLLTALQSREPNETAWSWFPPDQSVAFTWRMQTHEATMHRVDAELTAGRPIGAIPADIAADGIDHVVDVMWNWAPADAQRTPTGTLEFVATDTGQRWLVDTYTWTGSAWGQTFTDQAAAGRSADGTPAATVSGTAANLDLLVWTRADRDITREGDPAVLAAFQQVLDDGIQ
ncbi:maleylpyruvate isomerase family mycothiol-dependent enzyme [Calidifontibacter terrae]